MKCDKKYNASFIRYEWKQGDSMTFPAVFQLCLPFPVIIHDVHIHVLTKLRKKKREVQEWLEDEPYSITTIFSVFTLVQSKLKMRFRIFYKVS